MAWSPWLATWLDERFLATRGVPVLPPLSLSAAMYLARSGADVANELQGRLLLKYLRRRDLGRLNEGSSYESWAAITPYCSEDIAGWLQLPFKRDPRRHVLLIDPARVPLVAGSYWMAGGCGIQYYLPAGFPGEAVVVPGAPTGRWEVGVR